MTEPTPPILAGHPALARTLVFFVHVLTASGAAFSLLALIAAIEWRWPEMFGWLAVALFVDGIDGALAHIRRHGSCHTESIVTEDHAVAERFLAEVDAAIVLHNASTQFADGGEFGMGAEIGIATGKLHARGPVGAEQLTSYKYVVRGAGQVRP